MKVRGAEQFLSLPSEKAPLAKSLKNSNQKYQRLNLFRRGHESKRG